MKFMKDNWAKYFSIIVLTVGFCFGIYHALLNTRDLAVSNQKMLDEMDQRVHSEEINSAKTADVLNRVYTNIERLNAWQLNQVEKQSELNGRVKALENKP